MKKNAMMRVASIMLVLVLLTSSVISGTFAKYVTSGEASDSARVAKWGVTFDIEGGPLFSKQYATNDSDYSASMTYSVKSGTDENVVAPGTKGELISFRTLGTPEVSYEVALTVDETKIETIFTNKYIDGTEVKDIADGYYPVQLELNYNGTKVGDFNDVAKLSEAIEKCGYYFDVTGGKYYVTRDGGSNYTEATAAPVLTINWNWAFENQADVETYDKYDTTLGNLAAGLIDANTIAADQYNLEVALGLTATATQID